jgi:hypothetical protein
MPEKPRRILEKSSTVRRRYQRRNNRLQFTASQIEKIEREEQREKRAKRLREQEEKRIAKKKEKIEKEAKEREERKRLGRADTNAPKLPDSQPQLLSFFGKKKEPQEQPELRQENRVEQEDGAEQPNPCAPTLTDASDVETEYGGDALEDALVEAVGLNQEGPIRTENSDCEKNGPTASKMDAVLASRTPDRENAVPSNLSRRAPDSAIGLLGCLGESFEDETSILLQDVDPDLFLHTAKSPCTGSAQPTVSKDTLKSPISSCHHIRSSDGLKHSSLKDNIKPVQTKMDSTNEPIMTPPPQEPARREQPHGEQPEVIDIFEDPEDDFGEISTQDLMALDESEGDDFKENWHPNFPRDGRESQQPPEQSITPRRRHEPYNEIQASMDREPFTLLNRAAATPCAEDNEERIFEPHPSSKRALSISPSARKRRRLGAPGHSAEESVQHSSQQDDEFEYSDIEMEDLEELMK